MLPDFIINALLAGCLISIIAGPIGSVMLYQRLSFFSDAISHNALLGIAIGLFLGWDFNFAVFSIAIISGIIFFIFYEKKVAKSDTLLVIIAQVGLALGMIAVSAFGNNPGRLVGFLFGDILSVTASDIITIAITGLVIITALKIIWSKLLLLAFDTETAIAENNNIFWINLCFIIILALFIATAVKLVGVLLITALLIIPAATARFFAKTPEIMAILASIFGILAVCLGIILSYYFDFATAPSIVIASASIGFFAYLLKKR